VVKSIQLAVVSILMAGAAAAANQGGSAPSDQSFVKEAALDGMTEVQLGKLAQEKSQNSAIQSFGARMVKDHSQANEDLASIAKTKNLQVPSSLDSKHQKMVDDLSKKSGADFDAAYTKGMAKDHTKAVQLFTRESHAQDSEFAGFAKKTLPTLEEHKKMADKLVTEVRTAAAGNSSSPAHR
jgi:putative membrane protein